MRLVVWMGMIQDPSLLTAESDLGRRVTSIERALGYARLVGEACGTMLR